VEQTQQTTQGR